MVEGIALDNFSHHQRMALDPVERILPARLLGVVIGHFVIAPKALAALSLEKCEDRLPGTEFEREVGRHAGGEILRLVMNEEMDVAETDPQQAAEQILREGEKPFGIHLDRSRSLRRLDGIARRAIVERRQNDEIGFPLE